MYSGSLIRWDELLPPTSGWLETKTQVSLSPLSQQDPRGFLSPASVTKSTSCPWLQLKWKSRILNQKKFQNKAPDKWPVKPGTQTDLSCYRAICQKLSFKCCYFSFIWLPTAEVNFLGFCIRLWRTELKTTMIYASINWPEQENCQIKGQPVP